MFHPIKFKLCMIVGQVDHEYTTKTVQTLHGYNLPWDLHCHSRFHDLDFVSRSQMYQKYILQSVCF